MSKIDSSGLEHGRRGDKIYVVLNGQQIKKDPYRPTNPRSPAQQRHRAKIALINQLSAQLAEGPRHIPAVITAEVEGNLLRITCPDTGLGDMYAVPDEHLYVAVYLPDAQAAKLYAGPMRADCTQCTFELPGEWCVTHATLHVYVWFQATCFHRATGSRSQVRPDQASPSRYLGTFRC